MPKMNVKKGDTVEVLSGKDKGKQGLVLRAFPEEGRVLVEGVAIVKKAMRPNQMNQQGGIVEREGPIHMSNVMPWCEAAGAPSKIVMKRLEDGTRVRVYKINGETLND